MLLKILTSLLWRGPFAMEVFSSYFNVVTLIILLVVTGNDSASNKTSNGTDQQDVKQQFGKLLTTIANMNEKRFNALKEYTQLDSYKASDGFLRANKQKEKITVLSEDATKAIIHDTLREVICKGGISPELSKYREAMFRAEKNSGKINKMLPLNDENAKGIINEILHEIICKNSHRRKPKKSSRPKRLRHSNHHHDDFVKKSQHFRGKANSLPKIKETKKMKALSGYVNSEKYKAGKSFLNEAQVVDDNDHLDEIILVNDGNTKAIITDVLRDMICIDGIAPGLSDYKDIIMRSGQNKNYMLMLNDDSTKYIINEILRDLICKKGKRKIPKGKSTGAAWLRHTDQLIADYYDGQLDKDDQIDENRSTNRNKYSSKSSDFEDSNSNMEENENRNDDGKDPNNSNNRNDNHIYDKDFIVHDYEENQNEGLYNEGDIENIYGEYLRSSCWKEATKNCKKACKNSVKEICDEYMCSSRMKKDFKKKCKRNCKEF